MNERLEATVSGRVQMVMYRDFVCRKARPLKLVGEVQNLKDGTVRVVAEGTREQLEKLLIRLAKGPLLANVRGVVPVWKKATNEYSSFSINFETER